jgi:ribonuclease P protein component
VDRVSQLADNLGFDRIYRLLQREEFDRVFAKPDRLVERPFTLLYSPNRLGYPRLGMVISKKNLRQAVRRNRVRRAIRESFRINRPKLPSVDLVVLSRREIAQFKAEQLRDPLEALWTHLVND